MRAAIGPTSLWPYAWANSGSRRREAPSSLCTVRGWIASNVELKYLTLLSGPRGSFASTSHRRKVLGWASISPGGICEKRVPTDSGSSSLRMISGWPWRIAIGMAVNIRECTNETWMATGSRLRTAETTVAWGR
ncbi:hypothetical protein SMICM17S_07297 [Streptomyces microflavus]